VICIVCKKEFVPKETRKPKNPQHGLCCSRRCGGKFGSFSNANNYRSLLDRFLDRLLIGNDCWEYRAGIIGSPRHKQMHIRKEGERRIVIGAHVFSYKQFVGPIPDGMLVCHKCDNPPCVRPGHLFLGTVQDNALDTKAKGRLDIRQGEKNPGAKLTEAKVILLRELHASGIGPIELSSRFSIPLGTINCVVYRQSWKHL